MTKPQVAGYKSQVTTCPMHHIDILFEDNYLIAVNKPSGLLVVPTDKNEKNTLTNCLRENLKSMGMPANIFPCHRIDRETSGIVVYAKSRQIEKEMFRLFKDRLVKKSYLALVSGCPLKREAVITKRISGQEAVTKYRVTTVKNGYSVVELHPVTGRTNQIRIHLKSIGNPILGERKYAFGRDFKIKFKRTALHAKELSFTHPVTQKFIMIKAPVPEDIKKMV